MEKWGKGGEWGRIGDWEGEEWRGLKEGKRRGGKVRKDVEMMN